MLQAHVSALRKALGAGRDRDARARLRCCAARPTDLARFESLAERRAASPTPQRRAALHREALSLWRGPSRSPSSGASRSRQPAARGSHELRLDVLGGGSTRSSSSAEHEQLVGELQALVDAGAAARAAAPRS